jgi:hypothetical protein
VIGDKGHRKISLTEQGHQRGKADGDQHGLQCGCAAPKCHQRCITAHCTQHGQNGLRRRHNQGENECEMAKFGKHDQDVSKGNVRKI